VISTRLLRWAAWSPGIETHDQWHAWSRAPVPLERDGAPGVPFLPAIQRRRCDPLCRAMLHAAHACLQETVQSEVTSVFASRHGGFANMVTLLVTLAQGEALSPARFSHSVHNTPAGIFSIWAKNRQASTSISAGAGTFGFGFLEALGMLSRQPGRPVLLVSGEEAAPDPMRAKVDHDYGLHAVALLLGEPGTEGALNYGFEASSDPTSTSRYPDAVEFIRWYLGGESSLRICHPPHAWTWSRSAESIVHPVTKDQ